MIAFEGSWRNGGKQSWLKYTTLGLLNATGIFWMGRMLSSQVVTVLTYHRILPDKGFEGQPRLVNSIYQDEFEEQVAFISKRYHIVTGEEFRLFLEGKVQLPSF